MGPMGQTPPGRYTSVMRNLSLRHTSFAPHLHFPYMTDGVSIAESVKHHKLLDWKCSSLHIQCGVMSWLSIVLFPQVWEQSNELINNKRSNIFITQATNLCIKIWKFGFADSCIHSYLEIGSLKDKKNSILLCQCDSLYLGWIPYKVWKYGSICLITGNGVTSRVAQVKKMTCKK